MFATFVLLRIDNALPLDWHVDAFYQVDVPDALTEGNALKVALQLDPTYFKEAQQALFGMSLRARYNPCLGDGVLLFKTEWEMGSDELETYLKSLEPDELMGKIAEARFRGI